MNLQAARERAGMTMRELAAEVGCSRFTVFMIEAGRCKPVGPLYENLSNLFGPLDYAASVDNPLPPLSRGSRPRLLPVAADGDRRRFPVPAKPVRQPADRPGSKPSGIGRQDVPRQPPDGRMPVQNAPDIARDCGPARGLAEPPPFKHGMLPPAPRGRGRSLPVDDSGAAHYARWYRLHFAAARK